MVEQINESPNITLPSAMDISTVQDLYEKLEKYIDSNEIVHVDAGGVEKVTSAGMQLLVSFYKSLEKNKSRLIVDNITSVFSEAFHDFGLIGLLQKWGKEV